MFSPIEKTGNRYEDDKLFLELVSSMLDREDGLVTNMSNLSALIACYLEDVSWCGFYLLDGDILRLGPFQGLPACTRIRIGKGVCGTAYERNETIVVPDVDVFPGHIACSSATRSEVVVPLEGFGVLDLDSTTLERFTSEDARLLEKVMERLSSVLD